VFAQTFTDFEVIVVNDGSPDDTREVLRPLAEAGKIRYIEQKNGGHGAARNRGVTEARGEYVAFLDDDDLWPPDKLQWQVALMDTDPETVLVYGATTFFHEEKTATGPVPQEGKTVPDGGDGPSGHVWDIFAQQNYIQSPGATLIRTATFREIGGFDTRIWGTDDFDLYIRLAKKGAFRYQNRRALLYRTHPDNESKNVGRMYRNAAAVRRKHLGLLPRPGLHRLWMGNYRFLSRVFGDDFVNATGDAIRRGDKKQARSLWLHAVLLRPAFLGRRHTYYLLKNLI
ncbi:MAG: glycosyltransferase family 2 protein, partial [Cytophagales bacterium]|nr:glycosyltransferase family 2 protein [Armatimonadota bacterium]